MSTAVLDTTPVTPAITVTAGKGTKPHPYYEAVWNERRPDGGWRAAKQRIGKAWLDFDGRDETGRPIWSKRRGRVQDGYFDERRAHAAAPAAVERYRERQHAKHRESISAETITVRELAHEWLVWLRDVKSAAPATVEDYEFMLREPGTPAKRGGKRSAGRFMKTFGDRRAVEVEAKEFSNWLLELDKSLTPRNVNKHRQLGLSVFKYGQKEDTYKHPRNPAAASDKRREPPAKHVDYYDYAEVEALALAAEQGAHRKPRGRKRGDHSGPAKPAPLSRRQRERQREEQRLRSEEDRRDADLFRVLFGSGLRLGEARALRVRDVAFAPGMIGAMLDVRMAFSANQIKPPKSWKPRQVPVPAPAAEALARVLQRTHFVGPDDYVFCGRLGKPLSQSAIRKRYTAARAKARLRPVTLHGLRHAAGSILSKQDQVFAKTVLGHAHLSTTDRYTHGKVNLHSIAVVNAAYGVVLEDGSRPPVPEVVPKFAIVPGQVITDLDPSPRIRAAVLPGSSAPSLIRTGTAKLTCVGAVKR